MEKKTSSKLSLKQDHERLLAPKDGQLSSPVTLITDATKIVEAHYKKVEEMPYGPSLDSLDADKQLWTAVQTIEGAHSENLAKAVRFAMSAVGSETSQF